MCSKFNKNVYLGDGLIDASLVWLTWMSHIRILNIDIELLSQLHVNGLDIDRFLSLQILIVRQTNIMTMNEPLAIIARLGASSSLRTIHLQHYRVNSQLPADDMLVIIHQICQNMHRLKVMTIEFHTNESINSSILEKFTEIQKKNCLLEFIHLSSAYVELRFGQ